MQPSLAMRIAIPHWQGRIAPVFDAARQLLLVDVEAGRIARREEKSLAEIAPADRAAELADSGVDLLICGAISAPLQLRIQGAGMRVAAFLCGTVDEVLAACLNGRLAEPQWAMPGCRRWRGGEDAWPAGFTSGCARSAAPGAQGKRRRRQQGGR